MIALPFRRAGRRDVIVAAGNEQKRGTAAIVKIDGRGSVWIEIGESGLEQHVVAAGGRVPLISRERLLFACAARYFELL